MAGERPQRWAWTVRLEVPSERVEAAVKVLEASISELSRGALFDETNELGRAAELIDRVVAVLDGNAEVRPFLALRRRFNRAADRVLRLLDEPVSPDGPLLERVAQLTPHLPVRCAGRAGASWQALAISRLVFPIGWLAIPSVVLGWYALPIGLALATAVEWWLLPRLAVTRVGLFVDRRRIPTREIAFCRTHESFVEVVMRDGHRLELPEGPVAKVLREQGVAFR